ncbi:TetR/AcrR family transcriptional regulator [Cupriavidus basilensis]|uniref:TetR/AcrR family transcriptional regulator n=1 Tax=Cupriavidus basilensis TaxID=68895 RepID=A0ABT6AV87_9BURK|nr:TetR/AcrR family transcriptional regulator [Cupriavidus basilensis]MDF3836539.1 TetR/AcrR family transcriptional regulator [Cupriavidus basilensis]
MKTQSVREQLLEHTLVLIRRRGFNGFSYRDLAELVGVKTSSIHYYFPAKDDLVLEAVKEYSARISARLRSVDTSLSPRAQAEGYLESLRTAACSDQICLAGMLSTETLCLPESVHAELKAFYRMNEAWLMGLIERAQKDYGKVFPVTAKAMAQVIYGALQNGLIVARLFGAPERLEAAADLLLASVSE